jgi:ketosteroid isomerase-like protein
MGIWLHGTNRPRVDRDSNGCIALDNVDLIEIEPLINLYDSPIIVYDRINYLPVEEVNADAARVKAFVESWRRAWENKDFQAYQSKYARDFVNNDSKSFDAWMAHKKRLNKKYETIQVDLSDFRIFKHQDMITVTFKQHYRGNNTFDSRGVKRLYIRENPGNQYEIAAEVWRPAPPRPKVRYLSAEVKNRVLAQGRLTEKTVASAAAAKTAAKPAAAKTPAAKPYQTAKIEANKPKPPKAAPRTPPVQTQTAALIQNRPEENRPPKAPEPTPAPATKQAPVKAKQPEATAPAVNPRRKIRRTIREWLDAWRSKNLDEYLAHYHPAFQYKDMDLAGFREYKEELNAKYDQIDIKIDKMDIQVDGAKAKVTFIQDYRSDQYQDYGMKTLVLRKTNNQWKIQEETWQDISAGAKP